MLIIVSILASFSLFVLNLVLGMYYGFGPRHYWFPETLHFLGGFFVAMFFSNFSISRGQILIGLGAVTLVWELFEFLIAKIPSWNNYIKKKFRLKRVDFKFVDTTFDVFLNFAGALIFIYLMFK